MAGDLGPEAIDAALRGSFGRPLRWFDEVSSTNPVALQWAARGAPEGALVATDHQSAGKGRRGRAWLSAPGRLLQFSLVLRPEIPPAHLGLLSCAVGLAVAAGIDDACSLPTRVKWPNDVTVDGRKLAGILIETQVSAGRIQAAIAGVGVNVHWPMAELPAEIEQRATSVRAELERAGRADAPERARILAAILTQLERVYPLVVERRPELLALVSVRSDVLGNEVVARLPDGGTVVGRALRLRDDGSLEIEADGEIETLGIAEIEQIRIR